MRKEIWTFDDMLNMVTTAANEIAVSEFILIVFLAFGPHSQCKLSPQSIDMPSLYFQKNTLIS